MRKLAIALLAVPVLAVVYASAALGRSLVVRTGMAVGLGALLAFGVIAVMRPVPTVANPQTAVLPLTAAAFRTAVDTDRDLDEPVTIEFSAPMDRASVSAALTVEPPVETSLTWDSAGRTLTVAPAQRWAAGAYHTVTVDAGALAATGAPMATPARAAFLTREAAGARITATELAGKRITVDAAFDITFDRPVDPSSVASAIRTEPAVTGAIGSATGTDGLVRYTFTPTKPLRQGSRYRVIVDGVRDTDGLPVEAAATSFRTIASPSVVRFRPRAATRDVARDAAISVRFTRAMDRASTKAAFRVSSNGKAVAGRITFAEGDKVLVFVPNKTLPFGTRVNIRVAASARSKDGATLAATGAGWFKTVGKPAAPQIASGGSSGGGGGSAVGGGSWGSVETYYLRLMNCTRTGGWVTSSGRCSSPGGRNVAPLRLDRGISSKVARPYARKLAVGADCSHFIGGSPGDRLRRAGYTNYTWAENIGCRSGNPRSAVLGSHRYFQSEKSYNGGHYVNLMNSKYDRVGIGVWVSHGRVRLVVDFYHP